MNIKLSPAIALMLKEISKKHRESPQDFIENYIQEQYRKKK